MSNKNLQETNDNWTFVYVRPVGGTLDDLRAGHDRNLQVKTSHEDLGREEFDGWNWICTFLIPPTTADITIAIENFKYKLMHGGRLRTSKG